MKKQVKINNLVNFKNIKIFQHDDYFKVSLDSILLANFVNINSGKLKIIDLCTGNAPIPLILSTKTKSLIYGVELQKEIYNLAVETVKYNKLEKQIKLINNDIKKIYKEIETDCFDIITCNPPYFKKNNKSNLNNNKVKAIAKHEINISLNDIILISKKLLKNKGDIYLIHKTERLIDILELMKNNTLEPKIIRFIYPKQEKESNLVLISGKKNGKRGIKLLKPLFIHNDDGSYTEEVLKMFSMEEL